MHLPHAPIFFIGASMRTTRLSSARNMRQQVHCIARPPAKKSHRMETNFHTLMCFHWRDHAHYASILSSKHETTGSLHRTASYQKITPDGNQQRECSLRSKKTYSWSFPWLCKTINAKLIESRRAVPLHSFRSQFLPPRVNVGPRALGLEPCALSLES